MFEKLIVCKILPNSHKKSNDVLFSPLRYWCCVNPEPINQERKVQLKTPQSNKKISPRRQIKKLLVPLIFEEEAT